jgi:hypothetical protein
MAFASRTVGRRCASVGVVAAIAALPGCAIGVPQPATGPTTTSITLHGDVYSSVGGDTVYWFRYGETTALGSATPHRTLALQAGQGQAVSEPVAGLAADTTYHFSMCATDGEEGPPRINCSELHTFNTSGDAAAGSGDEIGVDGETSTFHFDLDARSGPEGENARGTASWRWQRGSQGEFAGTVTCLSVHGQTAIIGYTGLFGGVFNGKAREAGRIRVTDGLGPGGQDTWERVITASGPGVHWEDPDPPPIPGPSDCSAFPGAGAGAFLDSRSVDSGGVTLTDVGP